MGQFIIVPILAAIGITGFFATVLAEVIVIAIGIGLQLLVSTLFKPSQPKPSDGQVIIRMATAPRSRSYGRVKVGGVLMFANTQRGAYGRIIAMGSGEIDAVEEHWLDDNHVELDGNAVTHPQYQQAGQHKAFIEFRHGEDDPELYGAMNAAHPSLWTPDHLGKGIPSAMIVLHQVKSEDMGNMFPKYGETSYRQVQRGAKVANVSGGALTAPAWSDNAARVILDYLTHPDGLRLDPSWITNAAPDWEAAIAVCNETVGDEVRYRIWNTYRFDERPADVLGRYLQACDAAIYPTPDQGLTIRVGKWSTPTVTLDDDAILGFSEFGRGRDIMSTANTIRARYTSPDHDYLETDADPLVDEADVAARGEFAIDLDFFSAPSHSQCRRLMKVAAARANPTWVGVLNCNLRGLPVTGERFVNVVISELEIDETFEVLNVQWTIDQGAILTGVRVQIASLAASAYDWAASTRTADEGTPPSVPPLIVPERTIPDVTGIAVVVADNMVSVSWDPSPEDYLLAEVRYKQTALPDWLAAPVADGATRVNIGPLAAGTEYEFQVRYRSSTSTRVSDWSTSYTATTDDAPGVPPTPPVVVVSPTSGDTITMGPDERALYIDTAAVLAALTIKLPASAATAEDLIELCFAAPVTALSIQDAAGVPVPGAPTSAYGPGAAIFMRWVDEAAAWVYWK